MSPKALSSVRMHRLATLNYFRHHWFIILIRISVESLSPADASCSHRADSNPNKPCKSAFNPCVRSNFTNGSKCIEEPRKWSSELAKHYSTDWTRYLWRFCPQCFRKISNSWMHRTRLCVCQCTIGNGPPNKSIQQIEMVRNNSYWIHSSPPAGNAQFAWKPTRTRVRGCISMPVYISGKVCIRALLIVTA